MKKIFNLKFLAVAIIGMAMMSCKNDPEFHVSDLQALWLENSTEHYIRFTDEQSDRSGYFWGREWNLKEDVTEEDLFEPEDFHGNGWFHYQLEKKGDLHEIHMMSNDGAVIPKEYVVSKLTSTELEYREKDDKSRKFYFTKK